MKINSGNILYYSYLSTISVMTILLYKEIKTCKKHEIKNFEKPIYFWMP